jgi:hypothetical protein
VAIERGWTGFEWDWVDKAATTAGPWRPDLAIGQVRPGTPELVTAWEKKNEEELAKL